MRDRTSNSRRPPTNPNWFSPAHNGQKVYEIGAWSHSLLLFLICPHRLLIRLLRSAYLARALRSVQSFSCSLRSSWERDSCLSVECLDFILFPLIVQRRAHLSLLDLCTHTVVFFGAFTQSYHAICVFANIHISRYISLYIFLFCLKVPTYTPLFLLTRWPNNE